MIDINKKLTSFSVGAVSNFFGEFIAEKITKVYSDKENEQINIVSSNYVSAIIAGGFSKLVELKGFSRTIFILGLNYVTQNVLEKIIEGKCDNYQTFLADFIKDSILVYFIVKLISIILEMLSLEIDVDHSSFSERVLHSLITSVIINVVLNLRE